jgi:hypothetical protein
MALDNFAVDPPILNLGEVDAALAFDLADEAHMCSVYHVHYTLKLTSTYSGTLDTFKTPAKSSVALVFGWGLLEA